MVCVAAVALAMSEGLLLFFVVTDHLIRCAYIRCVCLLVVRLEGAGIGLTFHTFFNSDSFSVCFFCVFGLKLSNDCI